MRWLRPAEVCAEAGWPAPALFVDSSSSSDVVQGRLGDCWFLSALAVVALQPRLLARLFRRWDDPPASAGRCTLVFHHDGAWRPVTIDDRLPCDADGQLLYARSATPHEMWVPLVEKAFAKLHGGYEALVSGFADAAMRQLTGGAPQRRLVTPGAGDEKLFHDNIGVSRSAWGHLQSPKHKAGEEEGVTLVPCLEAEDLPISPHIRSGIRVVF